MARPPQEAIDTFKAITGTSDEVAVTKLEEYRGDLNAAINAHFSEADRVSMQDQSRLNTHQDFMDIDDQIDLNSQISRFSSIRASNPFSLLDALTYPRGGRNIHNNDAPLVSQPREVREIPIESKDGSCHSGQSVPTIEDLTETVIEHGSTVQGSIIIEDDEDNDPQVHPAAGSVRNNDEFSFTPSPSAPPINYTAVDDEIEEQMVRAAIEASKQEASSTPGTAFETVDAASLSLKTADGRTIYDKDVQYGQNGSSSSTAANIAGMDETRKANGRQELGPLNDGTSSRSRSEDDDGEDSEEQPLVRHRSSGRHGSAIADGQPINRPSLGPGQPQLNGDVFSDEWGGISSEERDEAVMLEAAMFGGVPESSSYPFAYHSQSPEENAPFPARVPRSPSPTLVAQRILREQQDDEYLASLAADRDKELKAMQEEEAAKQAALEQERHQKEEEERKLHEEEEYERQLAIKQASLPQEPALDDENAVTLLVRLPDGSRQGRRFLKSDKLQCLFDFIDVGKVVKPSTYRLVRPYPRRAFGEGEKELSLSELGLTSRQEALFLEMI